MTILFIADSQEFTQPLLKLPGFTHFATLPRTSGSIRQLISGKNGLVAIADHGAYYVTKEGKIVLVKNF
jgi:hypothetical protein